MEEFLFGVLAGAMVVFLLVLVAAGIDLEAGRNACEAVTGTECVKEWAPKEPPQ